MLLKDFQDWCAEEGLSTNTLIAYSLQVSSQTVRNWTQSGKVPTWVKYATKAVSSGEDPMKLSVQNIKAWQSRNGLKTYEDTGQVFGLKRQAVHQWFRRGKFPNWLSLACVGYELNY